MLQPCRHLVSVGSVNRGEVASYPLEIAAMLKQRRAVEFSGPPVEADYSGTLSPSIYAGREPASAVAPVSAPPAVASPAPAPKLDPRRFGKRRGR